MSLQPVPRLRHLAVGPLTLCSAEYHYNLSIQFGIHPKDDAACTDLKCILIGLLNTSGGLITLTSYGNLPCDDLTVDKWMNNLDDVLLKFIPQNIFQECISLRNGQNMVTHVLVKRSYHVITLEPFCFVRGIAGTKSIYHPDALIQVVNQKSRDPTDPLPSNITFEYGKRFEHAEGMNIELKFWKTASDLHGHVSKLSELRVRKTLFAFANNPEGGDMILGIEEDPVTKNNIIRGQILNDHQGLTTFICQFFKENAQQVKRIWGPNCIEPLQGRQWDINFYPVTDCPPNEVRWIVIIHVNHCPGGVYEEPPESYMICDDGFVGRMDFNSWHEHLVRYSGQKTTPDAIINTTSNQSSATKGGQTSEQPGASTQPGQSAYHVKGKRTRYIPIHSATKTHEKDVNSILKNENHLSWTENRAEWERNIQIGDLSLDASIDEFFLYSHILEERDPIQFTPSLNSVLMQNNQPKGLDQAFKHIQSLNPTGFAICTKQWLSNIQHDAQLPNPKQQVCDVLVVKRKPHDNIPQIDLWSIVNTDDPDEQRKLWSYLLIAGRITKKKLIHAIARRPMKCPLGINIKCHLYVLGAGEASSLQENITDTYFMAQPEEYDSLKFGLGAILLNNSTSIKTTFGDMRSIYLSSQQMESILATGLDRFNLIEGPPGSGKTYLALHLCTRYGKENTMYICTTKAFRAFLRYQDKCNTLLVGSEKDILSSLEVCDLGAYACVIIDDSHNITCSDKTWRRLFLCILGSSNTHLFVFADSRYQNFKLQGKRSFEAQLMGFCNEHNVHFQMKTLSVVHRNTRTVTSFIKSCFEEEAHFPDHLKISCTNPDVGDNVEIRVLQDIRKSIPSNTLIQFTKSLLSTGFEVATSIRLYAPRDIAILTDTNDPEKDATIFRKIFQEHFPQCNVQDASQFPTKDLIIDTLDSFMGLDSPVCLLVASKEIMKMSSKTTRSITNPKYKAFVSSRGIARVVFITEEQLTSGLAKQMKLNRIRTIDTSLQLAKLVEKIDSTSISLKVVVLGDFEASKSELISYMTGAKAAESGFDDYSLAVDIGGRTVILCFFDTAHQEDYDRLRPLSYPQTDIFLVCFSITSHASLANVENKWIPELTLYCPKTPYLLIGTKVHLRNDAETVAELAEKNMKPVRIEEGERMAEKIKAVKYIECSVVTKEGIDELTDETVLAGLNHMTH